LDLILICWGNPFTSQAGTEIYIGNLAKELAMKGHTINLIYGGEKQEVKADNFNTHPLSVVNIPFVRTLDFRRKCANLCNKLMNESVIDAVIASGSGTFAGHIFSRLKKLSRHKLVYYAMDSMKMEYERSKLSAEPTWTFANLDKWIRYTFLIKSDKSSCFHSDLILASSKDTADHLSTDYGVSSSKIELFYEGVPDDFSVGIEAVDPDPPVFLHIGGGPRKGTCYFLDALKILKEKYALNTKAVVTRASSTQANLAKKLDLDIEIYSYLPFSKLKQLYATSTALISPSLSEGFCLPIVEAAMFGKPAVVSNIGSLPELVTDGENGFVVPVADTTMLVEKMYQIAVNRQLRMRMGEKARQLSQRFTISSVAEALTKLLDNNITRNAKRSIAIE
jgi:glycosyltransferase involved in cell wall biosynthesis